LAKHLFGEVGSFGTVALRLFFAAAVLMLFWRPSLRMDRRMWTVVLAYGAVLGLMNLCFYSALARLPLGIAVTIEFLGPLAVALAGSRRWLDAFWAVLAGAGVVLLTEGGGELDPVGVLFALAAGACWGLYILVGAMVLPYIDRDPERKRPSERKTAVVLFSLICILGLFVTFVGVFFRGPGYSLVTPYLPFFDNYTNGLHFSL